jgi:hypothetical protein
MLTEINTAACVLFLGSGCSADCKNILEGTSKNSRYRSRATRLSSNDSGLFSFRFVDVHSRTVRDWQRNQFFEVPLIRDLLLEMIFGRI